MTDAVWWASLNVGTILALLLVNSKYVDKQKMMALTALAPPAQA
ncbi:hypothetical protein [Cupriavidus numazuensis]|nr:hypothetical protein [Cupriavidus numazuensis]